MAIKFIFVETKLHVTIIGKIIIHEWLGYKLANTFVALNFERSPIKYNQLIGNIINYTYSEVIWTYITIKHYS